MHSMSKLFVILMGLGVSKELDSPLTFSLQLLALSLIIWTAVPTHFFSPEFSTFFD
jgi:hypothetical protein